MERLIQADSAMLPHFMMKPIDASEFPQEAIPPRLAQMAIQGLRSLDATPSLNLASFVTTYMEEECKQLMMDAIDVNYIDTEEYPSTERIKEKCVKMLADLWHADKNSKVTGTDTVGSSEAVLLGGLALKRRWQDRMRNAGKDTSRPNIVMGTETHVVWEKLTNYMEIEPRWVHNRTGEYIANNEDLVAACDENTIGIVSILGTTYTGHFYDMAELDSMVEKRNKQEGWEIGIHVDAASGGFVAPFMFPDLKWDFRLKNVVSINASGHKFGLVYPGLGWVMWRSREYLPESLVFHDNYLGKDQITITLNFSKSAMNVVGQLYQFIRMGFDGYKSVNKHMRHTMDRLIEGLESMGQFTVVSAHGSTPGLPLVAFHLKDKKQYDEFSIADRLRTFGWVVPAYTLAKDNQERKVLRVVCRWDFNPTLVGELLDNLQESMDWLEVHHIYTEDQLQQIEKHEAQQAEEKGIDLAAVDASRSGAHCVTGPSSHAHHHHFHSKDNKDRSFHFVNLKRLTKH
eukprot:GHUV01000990.1.p1 GENE.GHUV01000990.1~~GHUV01000990.1.p1  ORF type:complete len:514 (+),score=113.87 GHUV01000990.1:240-1781(+)